MLDQIERDRSEVKKLLKLEYWTKQQACWFCNIPEKTWNRYMLAKANGDRDFADFPTTYKRGKGPRAMCYYRADEVLQYMNSWPTA